MPSVLLVGRGDLLTDTHKAILEQAGYQVQTAVNEQDVVHLLAQCSFDVVEILFTVPMRERHWIAATVQELKPVPKVLVLHNSGHCQESRADASVDSRLGPAQILRVLAGLLPETTITSESLPMLVEKARATSA